MCSGVGNNYGWGPSKETMKMAILLVNLVFLCFSISIQKCFTLFHTLKNWPFFPLKSVFLKSAPPHPKDRLSVYFAMMPATPFKQVYFFSPLLWKDESCKAPGKKRVKETNLTGRNYQIVISLKKKIWTKIILIIMKLFSVTKALEKVFIADLWRFIIPFSGEL